MGRQFRERVKLIMEYNSRDIVSSVKVIEDTMNWAQKIKPGKRD